MLTTGCVDEAEELLAAFRPEVVCSDLNMPGRSSLELLRTVMASEHDIAFVMVTNVEDGATAQLAIDLGVHGYVVKPFGRNELLINVVNAVRRRDLEEAERHQRTRLETEVGKIGIPDAVLMKPGRFDEHDRAIMNRHPEIGHRILSGSDSELLDLAATIALTHHERWDGTGYPHGLAGDAIPLEGRIVALDDMFDALGSTRRYKAAFSIDQTIEVLEAERGSHFDPDLVDLLLADVDELLAIRVRHDDPTDHDDGPGPLTTTAGLPTG